MAASLKGIDPALKQYLKIHRLPEVYEALLSGIAIMCPDDPYQFIIDKLRFLQEKTTKSITWDMFIEEFMKPKIKVISESNLDYIFNFDENMQPTPEMYEKAYNHYNIKLLILGYSAWMQYHLLIKRKREEMEKKMVMAGTHYVQRIQRIHIETWKKWLAYRKGCQALAFNKIQHVYNVAVGRVIFQAWRNVTLDAKRTREYFESSLNRLHSRLERGENMEDDDVFTKSSGEARDDISALPKHVAIQIFSHVDLTDLARCACVCRSWKVLTQSNLLWSRLDFTRVRHRVTDKIATKLLSKCRPYLVHLNVRGCQKISADTFISVRECKNLQDLNLSDCRAVNDDTLRMVTEGCKILLFLNVSSTDITDASLRSIAKNCTNLQYLSLAHCQKYTDKGLNYLSTAKGARRLIYLDLSGCIQLTPEGYGNISKGCTSLQTAVLDDLFTLDDVALEAFIEHLRHLKCISLLGSPNISDEPIKNLASKNRGLVKIKIESNQRITDACFKTIGKLCSDLRHLYLVDCQKITDATLKSLTTCRNLVVVNFADCVRLTDQGVRQIMESPCGTKIQELNLTNCIRVGDIALVNIHKRCHNLAYLSVCFCEHISKAGIELLGQTHSLVALDISGNNCEDAALSALGSNSRFKDVNLSECVAITDLGLQKFAQQCQEIERLDISHCQLITDGAIKNLAFCCRMLTGLNLAGCKLLTDLSVQYLSGVCHHLAFLDISGSLHITDKSLKYLKKGCKKMKTLVMLYCRNISKHAAHKLMKTIPDVMYSDEAVPSFYNY